MKFSKEQILWMLDNWWAMNDGCGCCCDGPDIKDQIAAALDVTVWSYHKDFPAAIKDALKNLGDVEIPGDEIP